MEFDHEKFEKGMEKITEKHQREMNRIDEEFRKRRKKIDRKFLTIWILLFSFFIIFNVRNGVMINTTSKFKKYSRDYCNYLEYDLNKNNITVYDKDILYKKLLPYYWRSFVNPFEWTELQISKDDELLRKCKEAYLVKEKERQDKKREAEETFNERIKN